MKTAFLVAIVLGLLVIFAEANNRRRINDLELLLIERQVKKLQWFYNNNMDTSAAVFSKTQNRADPEFTLHVDNTVGVFCPDPEFQGWTATGGGDGGIQMYARHRDLPVVPDFTKTDGTAMSVDFVYRHILPGSIFVNSSQHFVGMENVEIGYREDGRLYAEFNATLRQSFNQFNPATPDIAPAVTEIFGRYNNEYLYYDPSGGSDEDAYWCMRRFNAFNGFTYQLHPQAYTLTPQNPVGAQLGYFVRPGVGRN